MEIFPFGLKKVCVIMILNNRKKRGSYINCCRRAARTALSLFLAQLAVNALWSWLFFGWHMGALAFADIVLLWALIVAMLIAFWRIRPLAGALLLPYLLWVSFASANNFRRQPKLV
jgi:tryptophan-rich sensory protein